MRDLGFGFVSPAVILSVESTRCGRYFKVSLTSSRTMSSFVLFELEQGLLRKHQQSIKRQVDVSNALSRRFSWRFVKLY